MVLTPSTMLSLGTKAPGFKLKDVVTSRKATLGQFTGEPILVMFICRHCPYVQHIKAELAKLGRDYDKKAIALVAISSNDAEKYPDDAPASLAAFAKEEGFTFPFFYDADQSVAQSYTAACTPDFFLFDKDHRLVYRGQLDDSRPGNGLPVTGKDLREAIEAVLAGGTPSPAQRPSIGCNIKWKPGLEPAYFSSK